MVLTTIVKNICWVASSATRASILRAFSREENLGDLTAKYASQSTAASLLGTGLGLGVSHLFSLSTFSNFSLAFIPFGIGLLYGLYKTTSYIRVTNLTFPILLTIFFHFECDVKALMSRDPDVLYSFLKTYNLLSPDSIHHTHFPANLERICVNSSLSYLNKISKETKVWDFDSFLLCKDPSSLKTYLWIKEPTSFRQIVGAILSSLFLDAWDLTPEISVDLVRLFIEKLVTESFWNLEPFVPLSPELKPRSFLKPIGSL